MPPADPPTRSPRRHSPNDASHISFVAAIAVALSLVASVFVANYYTDHGAPVASVNGEAISKDAVRDRVALNVARDKRQVQDYLVLAKPGQDHRRRVQRSLAGAPRRRDRDPRSTAMPSSSWSPRRPSANTPPSTASRSATSRSRTDKDRQHRSRRCATSWSSASAPTRHAPGQLRNPAGR